MKSIVRFFMNLIFCKFLYHVKYINTEKVKKLDRCLICPNHSNTLEPTWIYANNKDLAIMAKAELFENKFVNVLFRYFGAFPIHRGMHDTRSLIHAINLFKNVEKRKLLIFPEGKRLGKDEKRAPAKVGPLYIASKANVPIVPVYITKNAKLFHRVYVIYGNPIYIPKDIIKDKENLNKNADKIMDIIYNLKNEI